MTTENVHQSGQIASVTEAEEVTARLQSLMGVSDRDEDRAFRIRSINAQHNGGTCGLCHRALDASEPVYRQPVHHRALRRGWLLPVCSSCKSDWQRFFVAEPCGHCGRPVHDIVSSRPRKQVFCCDRCQSRFVSAKLHAKRVAERGTFECAGCGETFEPTRADAKFCSAACKQKAHRRTVTARKSEQIGTLSTGNAGERP